MDFFEHQHQARQRTGWLVLLFALAVAGIILAAYLVVALAIVYSQGAAGRLHSLWEPQLLLWIGTGVIVLVAGGTGFKLFELRAGGKAVAESLGGQLIEPGLADPQERKLLNVIEEMAIASGTPVPPVYILGEEDGINAFAAGFSPNDAVVGVTRGAVKRLGRDELQGVVAHEFSHILNGDMRLNLRLIGVLHGILVIGLLGYVLLRAATQTRRTSSRRKGSPLPLIAIGAGLMTVGYIGTFFGKLIKSAVSRQREFLADASSVQFTRNPGGLTGALRKIGGLTRGSRLITPNAETASHLFFGPGVNNWLGFLFATHPDLAERIRRIDPSWDGSFVPAVMADAAGGSEPVGGDEGPIAAFAGRRQGSPSGPRLGDRVGRPARPQLARAAQLIREMPAALKSAAREPFSARAIVYALLIDQDPDVRARQLGHLDREDAPAGRAVRQLLEHTAALPEAGRLPLVEMAMPALRRLSAGQFAAFEQSVEALVRADRKVRLFEWMIRRVVLVPLKRELAAAVPVRVQYYGLRMLTRQCEVLLSTLAYSGHNTSESVREAFAAGARCLLDVSRRITLAGKEECGLSELDAALKELAATAPRIKRQLVDACAATILADSVVTPREAELLRAVAAALDCPMPPMDLDPVEPVTTR